MKRLLQWNEWRGSNTNSRFYQFLVLIGFIKSPTLEAIKLEWALHEAFMKGLEGLDKEDLL